MTVIGISPKLIELFISEENRHRIKDALEDNLCKRFPRMVFNMDKLYEIQLGFLHFINELNFKIYEGRDLEEVLMWLNDYFIHYLVPRCEETFNVQNEAMKSLYARKQLICQSPFPQKEPIEVMPYKRGTLGHMQNDYADKEALREEYELAL